MHTARKSYLPNQLANIEGLVPNKAQTRLLTYVSYIRCEAHGCLINGACKSLILRRFAQMLLLTRQLCLSPSRVLYGVHMSGFPFSVLLYTSVPPSVTPKAQPFHSSRTYAIRTSCIWRPLKSRCKTAWGRFIAVDCCSQVRRALAPLWDIEIPTSKLTAPSSICWQIASSYRQRQKQRYGYADMTLLHWADCTGFHSRKSK